MRLQLKTALLSLLVLLMSLAPAYAAPSAQVVVILDASASMHEVLNDGSTKMQAALKALDHTFGQLPNNVNATLRVYGGALDGAPLQPSPCRGSSVLLKNIQAPASRIAQTLYGLSPYGATPISQSLVQAVDQDLSKHPGAAWSIVLISDGAETCNISPCRVVLDLVKAHPNLTIHSVGFGHLNSETVKQLQCLSAGSWGNFLKANSLGELEGGLGSIFQSIVSTRARLLKPGSLGGDALRHSPASQDIRF